jgi:hypothetical protein
MAEKFYMAGFGIKIHDFLIAQPLNEIYFEHCYIVKNLLPVVKNLNGGYIQDGVENVYIFHPIFSKMIFLSNFLLFLFTLG